MDKEKIESRKSEIRERLAKKMESPRMKEIREKNEASKMSGLKIIARDRHERRHQGKKGTSLEKRKEWMSEMSKDI